MPIIPVSGSAFTQAGASPQTVTSPVVLQANDLVVVSFASGSTLGGITPPSGWSQSNLGTIANSTIFNALFWHIVTPYESQSWSFVWANAAVSAQVVFRAYRGTDRVTPIDVGMGSASGTTTPDTAPSITLVDSGCLVEFQLVAVNNISWTPPAVSPPISAVVDTGGGNEVFAQNPVANGATGTKTFTPSATSGRWLVSVFGIKPFSQVAHSGLSGSGSITIGSPSAVKVVLTGLTPNNGVGKGNPVPYYNLGNIAWGTVNGALRNYYLQHDSELILAPIADATVLYYRFGPGITGVITELITP